MNGCRFKVVFSLTKERDEAIRDRMRQDVCKMMMEHEPIARWALLYGKRHHVAQAYFYKPNSRLSPFM